jgi:hypothetical protein
MQVLLPFTLNIIKSSKFNASNFRCLFIHSGHLIASISSHSPSESIFTSILPNQLNSILQFSLQKHCQKEEDNGRKLKSQTEQSWLFSKTLRRRQLHNLFTFSLSEHFEIICVASAGKFFGGKSLNLI